MKPRVLFLCTGNTARSQMAEAFLRREAGESFEVYSAGLEPGVIHPFTRQVMTEVGLDLAGQYSKDARLFMGQVSFDYVITVCDQAAANCPVFPGGGLRLHWSFEDPAAAAGPDAERLAGFRRVRDEIEARIRLWLAETPGAARSPAGS